MSDTLRVLVFPPPDDGCTWYRQVLWTKAFERNKDVEVLEIDPKLPEKDIALMMSQADVLFLRASNNNQSALIKLVRHNHPQMAIIGDTDDDLFNISPSNNSYDTLGVEEVHITSRDMWLWKDGEGGFDLLQNRLRRVEYEWVLSHLDMVTCTTLILKERLEDYNEHVAVLPNAVFQHMFPKLPPVRPVDELHILWAGGSSHIDDLELVKPAIKAIMELNPQVHFHMVGQIFPQILKDMPEGRTHAHSWVKSDGHGYRLATIGAHIGIAPLLDNYFNYAKSSVKFYEYAALGMATVATAIPPYAVDIQPDKTGILVPEAKKNGEIDIEGTRANWQKALQALIDDPIKRLSIANNAYEWTLKNRDMWKIGEEWLEVFRATSEARKERVRSERKTTGGK